MTELSTIPISRLNNTELDTKIKTEIDKNGIDLSTVATNCITEIPQDIKLELNAGTLTLKAGSKVYIPNGPGVFDVVTIPNNLPVTRATGLQEIYVYRTTDNSFSMWNNWYSGTTAPSGNQYMLWYDTANNKIKATSDSGSTWSEGFSFPVCLAKSTSRQITSINQVFNGFGYIGSTVFVLPGVKGLIPNGRNEDGTLKNIECVYTSPQTLTLTSSWGTGNETFFINGYNLDIHRASPAFYVSDSKPSIRYSACFWFNPKENQHYYTTDSGASWAPFYSAQAFEISFTSGVIGALKPKTTFQAVDYSDKETVVSWGKPNYKAIIDIGNKYSAPTNGFLRVRAYNDSGTAYGYIDGMEIYNWIGGGNSRGTSIIPIRKGTEWTINGNFEIQQFIPCVGG